MVFYRSEFTELWITLRSDEQLGLLDVDYLEDYYGTNGQITLYHPASGQRFSVLMVEVPSDTPSIPHDSFVGYRLLSDLPDGNYEVQCRVRDRWGNYTIIGAFQGASGGERLIELALEIRPGFAHYLAVDLGAILFMGAVTGGQLQVGYGEGALALAEPPEGRLSVLTTPRDGALALDSIPEGRLQYALEVLI